MFKKLLVLLTGVSLAVLASACAPQQFSPANLQAPLQPSGIQSQAAPLVEYKRGMMQSGYDGPTPTQPAPGNPSRGEWWQRGGQNQPYGRGPGMRSYGQRGGWSGYDNCMGGYSFNNGYAPGQTSGSNIPQATSQQVSFSTDIQPIFDSRCISCHGGTEGLYLDSYTGVMNGSMGWPVVIPGDPINSRLIQLVSSGYMPYGGPPLSQAQIQILVDWVTAGAPNN